MSSKYSSNKKKQKRQCVQWLYLKKGRKEERKRKKSSIHESAELTAEHIKDTYPKYSANPDLGKPGVYL